MYRPSPHAEPPRPQFPPETRQRGLVQRACSRVRPLPRYCDIGILVSRLSSSVPSPEHDAELMRRVAEGDAVAFRQLADRHLGSIVRFATRWLGRKEEAEEVAQETFLRVWQHARTYEPTARVSTWLHKIAHNAAIDRLREILDLPEATAGLRERATQLIVALGGTPEPA